MYKIRFLIKWFVEILYKIQDTLTFVKSDFKDQGETKARVHARSF